MELNLTRETDWQINVTHVISALKEKYSILRENKVGEISPIYSQALGTIAKELIYNSVDMKDTHPEPNVATLPNSVWIIKGFPEKVAF